MTTPHHVWIRTDADAHETYEPIGRHVEIDCHRRRRGPYTGIGSLLRLVVPALVDEDVALVARRATEITAIAPELVDLIPPAPQTLTNLAEPRERTRFYPSDRTQRLAHGVTELLTDWARQCCPNGVTVVFREFDDADATDREAVATMLRRIDGEVLRIIVDATRVEPGGALERALFSHAAQIASRPIDLAPPLDTDDLAVLYIESDCLDLRPAVRDAYLDLDPAERARLHDDRARRLGELGEPSLELGAILFHLERGSDPAGAAGIALARAIERCSGLGFYDAELELCRRALEVVTLAENPTLHCRIIHKMAASYLYMGRVDDAVAPLAHVRRISTDPVIHMNTAYTIAMMYTRLLPDDRKDNDLAREWINSAIAFADLLSDPDRRAFSQAFMRNGKALVELHRRDLPAALALVDEAIALANAGLAPDDHRLHRCVLRHNRAQVMAALGDHRAALADMDEAVRSDPEYGDYYFDRAAMYRAVGRYADALEDYTSAIRLSPPFHEAHYNRADLLRELGDDRDALTDLDYVLELDPDNIDALLNRAGALLALGELTRAAADIARGLLLAPDNAAFHCARGDLLAAAGDAGGAHDAYTAALDREPGLVVAWANRAVAAHESGRFAAAVDDLDHALALADDPGLRVNRAIALLELGDAARAASDLDAALESDADPDAFYWRGRARRALGDGDGATRDWDTHLAAYATTSDSPYYEQLRADGHDVDGRRDRTPA